MVLPVSNTALTSAARSGIGTRPTRSVRGRPRSAGRMLKISDTAGVKLRMIRWRSRKMVATRVLSNRLVRSLLARSNCSTLPCSSALTVCSSSLTDWSSSLEASSSSLVDCSSSFTETSSSLEDFSSSSAVSYSSTSDCSRSRVSRSSRSRCSAASSDGPGAWSTSSRLTGGPTSVNTTRKSLSSPGSPIGSMVMVSRWTRSSSPSTTTPSRTTRRSVSMASRSRVRSSRRRPLRAMASNCRVGAPAVASRYLPVRPE